MGLITYMRTDSTRIADTAKEGEAANSSETTYGSAFQLMVAKIKKNAQGAQDAPSLYVLQASCVHQKKWKRVLGQKISWNSIAWFGLVLWPAIGPCDFGYNENATAEWRHIRQLTDPKSNLRIRNTKCMLRTRWQQKKDKKIFCRN